MTLFYEEFVIHHKPEPGERQDAALYWDPATIQMEIEQTHGIDIPPGNFDRLMTAIHICTSNAFYRSPVDFGRACVVLSGHHPTPELMILPDCADLAWGMTEAMLLSPPDPNEQNPFSAEIVAYIGKALDDEGIINPPDILRIAMRDQDHSAQVNYDYSDSPEDFSAIQGMESDKTDSINHLVMSRMVGLIAQLEALPMKVGRTHELARQLMAKLPKTDEPMPLPD